MMSEINIDADRRIHVRAPLQLEFHLAVGGKSHIGVTGNVSLGGVYLEKISPELQKTDLARSAELTLQLNSDVIILNCQIVYICGDAVPCLEGIGVAFDEGQDEKISRLKKFIIDHPKI